MSIYFYLQSDSSGEEEEEEKKKIKFIFSALEAPDTKAGLGDSAALRWGRNTPHKTARTSFGQS